jgi:hypothetical protein
VKAGIKPLCVPAATQQPEKVQRIGHLSQGGKVSSSLRLKQEHFGWFELAGARVDRVTQYFEGDDS